MATTYLNHSPLSRSSLFFHRICLMDRRFGLNAAKLVTAVHKMTGETAYVGFDLDVEGTSTTLPYISTYPPLSLFLYSSASLSSCFRSSPLPARLFLTVYKFVKSFRSIADYSLFPLQLCALSGLANSESSDRILPILPTLSFPTQVLLYILLYHSFLTTNRFQSGHHAAERTITKRNQFLEHDGGEH